MKRSEFFKRVDGISGRLSEMEKEIRRLKNIVGYKRRSGQDYDEEARELLALLIQCDEIARIRGFKMTPVEKINSIRGGV